MKRVLTAACLAVLPVLLTAETPDWPLRIEIKQSSSFAEYRGLRFHAGIDLKTRGETGHAVHAMADGFVSRLKVQHRGAGNSVYLDHPGLAVRSLYAHLERFAEPMARYIADKQARSGSRYGIDDFFGPEKFPVKKGQIIGYSGETGLGPPHLHFETRKLNDDPISPSSLGLVAPDTSIPQAFHLHVDPLSPKTLINGGFHPVTVPLAKTGPGSYGWKQPVRLAGRAGLAIGLIDHGEGGSRFGVGSVRLELDGKALFERRFDTFSYDQNPQCPYVYDHPKTERPGTGFVYTLFRWPFDTTPFSAGAQPWAGVLDLTPGPHAVRIVARDFAGNQVVVEGPVVGETLLEPTSPLRADLRPRRVVYCPTSVIVDCGPPAGPVPPRADSVTVTDASGREHLLPAVVSRTGVSMAFPIAPEWAGGAKAGALEVLPPHRYLDRAGGEVEGPRGLKIRFPEGGLNLPILARVDLVREAQAPAKAKSPALVEVSPVWTFAPPDLVTDKPAAWVFPLPPAEDHRKIGAYRWREGRSYACQGGEAKGGTLTLGTRVPMPLVLVRDLVPPRLTYRGRRTLVTLGRVHVFEVADEGSGIDWYATRAAIGGKKAEADSDPDRDEIYVLEPSGQARAAQLAVQVSDQAGNVTAWHSK